MPDLNCTEFEARLMQMVEDRESLDAFEDDADRGSTLWQELRAQANACPHCRKLWNEFALLERVLPAWRSQLPQVDLADRVIARWREEQTVQTPPASRSPVNGRKKSGWRFPWTVVMGVAVAVLLTIRFVFPPQSDPDLSNTITTSAPVDEPLSPDVTPSVPNGSGIEGSQAGSDWQTLAQDAGTAYWALASDAADSFASVAVFVPPRKPTAVADEPEEPAPAGGWVEGIGSGLKPIGQDVKKSLGFLLEALPTDPSTI
jgi:hypothetical protein